VQCGEFTVHVLADTFYSDEGNAQPNSLPLFHGHLGAESQEGGGLARPGPTGGPKVPPHQRSDEVPARVEATVATD